jgi:hypothetical protein
MVNNTTPQFFVDADGLPVSVIERPNGDFFINNYGSTLALGRVRHYSSQGQLLRRMNSFNSGLPDYFIDNIQTDSAGNMWFACGEAGLSRMSGSNGAPDQANLWRNWGNHNDDSEIYPFAGNEPMYAILEAEDGQIWMGGNGVARWNPVTNQVTGFWNWQNSTFGVDDFNSFAQTADGSVWVGCGYAGAFSYNAQTNNWVQKVWGPSGSTANEVLNMTTDTAGNLWILTAVALHRQTPQGTWTEWNTINSPLHWSLFSLIRDPVNGVWIGISDELLHFDGTTWSSIHVSQAGWPAQHVVDVDIRESDGAIAVATQQPGTWPYTGGVSLSTDGGETWTHWTPHNSPLTHWQVVDVEFDNDGDLWASPMSEGVVEIDLEPVNPQTPGDVNGDGVVNVDDLLAVITGWGACPTPPVPCPADVTGDGAVNIDDLLMVITNWG